MFIFANMKKKQKLSDEQQQALKLRISAIFLTQKALADGLGLGPMTVCQWFRLGRQVPSEHCVAIADLSSGAIALHELRPDLYPVPDGAAA